MKNLVARGTPSRYAKRLQLFPLECVRIIEKGNVNRLEVWLSTNRSTPTFLDVEKRVLAKPSHILKLGLVVTRL